MKKTLLSLLLVTSLVQAEEVVVVGYGNTFAVALRNAKIAALEKVTGTWIDSKHSTINGRYTEEMVQYNGGVIRSYTINSYDGEKLNLTADVDVIKDNRVRNDSGVIPNKMRNDLTAIQEKEDQIGTAVYYLNNPEHALKAHPQKIHYTNRGNITTVKITGIIGWSPKWYSDVESLAKTINRKGSVSYNMQNKIVGSITTAMIQYNPLVAAGFGVAASEKEPEYKKESMVCFANYKNDIADACYETGYALDRFQYGMRVEVWGKKDTNIVVKKQFTVKTDNLYENIYPGDTKHHRNANGINARYYQPGLALYKNGVQEFSVTFDVLTNKLRQVQDFTFVIL